jgi:cytidyltransferase-like protein
MRKVGLVLGRFDPFHNGHVALIREAQKHMDKVWVIVQGIEARVPAETRASWIRYTFPEVEVEWFNHIVTISMATSMISAYEEEEVTHYYHSGVVRQPTSSFIKVCPYDIFRKANPIVSANVWRNIEENKENVPEIVYKEIKIIQSIKETL